MSRFAVPPAVAALLLCGCGGVPSPGPDLQLFDRFAAVGDGREGESSTPERAEVAGSDRMALVSRDGVSWHAPAGDLAGGAFAFSLSVLGSENGTAIIERTTGDGSAADREELFRAEVAPGAWIRRRMPLTDRTPGAADGEIRLVLRSEGAAVAWAEVHWLPASFGSRVRPQVAPDLVLISIDTLRSDHLSAYGYRRPTSPALDRLAGESLWFTRSAASSTWTLPSTATLLTGLLPVQHGLRKLGHQLAPGVESVAERLRSLGYRTVAITDGGFVGPDFGFNQGFERYDATAGEAWGPKDVATIAEAASRWIEENRFHPYFLFVHTYETHQPYSNREGFADPFLDPAYGGRFQESGQVDPQAAEDLDDADRRRLVDLYDGEIRRADHYLGHFLDRLRSSGNWQNTGVVVTSDHGEEFGEHGDFDHGFGKVFDANVAVPLIVKLPGAGLGRRLEVPVSGLDVAPTLLAMAAASTDGLAGTPLAELAASIPEDLAPEDAAPQDVVERAVVIHGTNSFLDVREERFRLDLGTVAVVFDKVRGSPRWYDLRADPEMRQPREAVFAGVARPAAERLQAILSWSAATELLARLPDEVQRIVVPEGSKVVPRGAWSGLLWRPAERSPDGRWTVRVDAGRPHVLALSAAADGRGWALSIERRGRPAEELRLGAGAATAGWHPFRDPLPSNGVLFPGSVLFRPETAELSPENVEELKALGYL